MTRLEAYLNIGFNFFDQIAIEKINDIDFFKLRLNRYSFFLRVFDLTILYSLYFLVVKTSQFILSLLFKTASEDISYVYYIFPMLLIFEYGATKKETNFFNILLLIGRASLKFGVLYSIDLFVMSLFG